jgi:altronate hydrolase
MDMSMQNKILKLDHRDNALVALTDLKNGEKVGLQNESYVLIADIPAKHKFASTDLLAGTDVIMYGVLVGKATETIRKGDLLTTRNIHHQAALFHDRVPQLPWTSPDVSRWKERFFQGYRRPDGQVGTRNFWLIVPLVFCENRNIVALKQAFEEELGLAAPQVYRQQVATYVRLYREGRTSEINNARSTHSVVQQSSRIFENIDGIKFLTHEGGCGGTREDSTNLCGLLAGYVNHPNVAGATVLSLGCQNAQIHIFKEQLYRRNPQFGKPLLIFEQQKSGTEAAMVSDAIRDTFLGLIEANKSRRTPAPLSGLCVGLKCGGSDGFSGISANPAIGHTSDLIVALGGRTILSEFPELCGVEQELINRCTTADVAAQFTQLMQDYAARARAARSGFDMNPSPGNMRDGLLTDAMKSAGAAKKGGTSPITAVLDYPEPSKTPGLSLQCTPGNDVECVTAQVGAGASVVLFTTGLGTPTGNPITPVVKLSTNSTLAQRMPDIIDFDTGGIITGESSIEHAGEEILDLVLNVASGNVKTKAELKSQEDFIPWKRGVSL